MPGPAPLRCPSPECEFQTPANVPTWENMLTILQLHVQLTHPVAALLLPVLRLPRPVFSLNMSEGAWQFKVIEWHSYIGQTPTNPGSQLLQFRAACDEELRQRV